MSQRGLSVSLLAVVCAWASTAQATTWTATDPPFSADPNGIGLRYDPLGDLFAGANEAPYHVKVRPPGGVFGSPFGTPSAGNLPATYAFDDAGDAVVVSSNNNTSVDAAWRPAGPSSALGPPQAVGAGASLPNIAVDPAGNALAAWATSDGKVTFADRPTGAGSSFGTPAHPTGDPVASAPFSVNYAVVTPILDPGGSAALVYTTFDPGPSYTLHAVYRSGPGAFTTAATTVAGPISFPSVVSDRAGDAIAVWSSGTTVLASYRPSGGVFGAPETVGTSTVSNSGTGAVMLGDGRVAAVWNTTGPLTCNSTGRIAMAFRTAGVWSATSSIPGGASSLSTGRTGDHYLLAYAYGDCNDNPPAGTIRAAFEPFGTLDATLSVAVPGQVPADDNGFPTAAMDPAGNGFVLYHVISQDPGSPSLRAAVSEDATPGPTASPTPGATATPTATPRSTPTPSPTPSPSGDPADALLDSVVVIDYSGGYPSTITVSAKCLANLDACAIEYGGYVGTGTVPNPRAAAAKAKGFRVKLKRVKATVAAGKTKQVKIKLPKRARSRIRAALKKHVKVHAVLTVKVNGHRRAKPLVITLKPKH
jgi:hypothetical protein